MKEGYLRPAPPAGSAAPGRPGGEDRAGPDPARPDLSGPDLSLGRTAPASDGTPRRDAPPAPTRVAPAPAPAGIPEPVIRAVRAVRSDLAGDPFRAPEADRLRELGLDARAIAAAAHAGLLLRVSEQVVLAPGADTDAAAVLAGLPQPFTTAEARKALGTTRRVAIPLLEFLDRARITERLPDDRRRLRPR